MLTLRTPEEPNLTFICRTQLSHPPFSDVITAFRTFNLRCREYPDIVGVINDGNFLFRTLAYFFHSLIAGDVPNISTLFAFKLAA
jgi:hypothetical protein